ncbi:MAG: shikimate dehydrogenase [Chloroherpetonaceae bacterium]|nr:shikimate dehydrogenase [Chthonomonadaceae bacterium]MDW8208636.1 shikimate dehydrogenase [Chloroherpetonaceae bacterium]
MPVPTSFLAQLVALFGQPVAENPTQYMQEQAFAARGLNWRYITMEVPPDHLADAVRGLRGMGFAGANCTIPHKVAVIQHLDDLTSTARKIGAVNTIVRQRDGSLLGENTDGKGFLRAVQEAGLDVRGVHAVVLGAGGAARAIAVELAVAGARQITVVNRTPASAETLATQVRERTGVETLPVAWRGAYPVPAGTQLLVNATSIALFPNVHDVVPVDYATIRPDMLVCDVIPNPPDTPFLQNARAQGARTLDGLGMLVYQGAIAFQMWTGEEAPIDVMRRALEEVFAQAT